MKKIVIISPVKNIERVHHTFVSVAQDKNIQLEFKGVEQGLEGVATYFDRTIIAPEIVRLAYQAEQNGAAAVIINCLAEPGLQAAKELLSIPVIGIFEASLQAITVAQKRLSILLPKFHDNYLKILQETIKARDLKNLLTEFYRINIEEPEEKKKSAVTTAIKDAINHSQVIILSSTYLAQYQDYCQEIIDATNDSVSLIVPLIASIRYVEKIFNGTQRYDKENLLPPNTGKVSQWYEEVSESRSYEFA